MRRIPTFIKDVSWYYKCEGDYYVATVGATLSFGIPKELEHCISIRREKY
ncbi:hypothetical protein [Leptospira santarosai]|nr:hypothetical protein [Leptospira santarosai]